MWQSAFVGSEAARGPEGEGAAATGVLGAPVGHRGVIHGAQPVHSDHVVAEPVVQAASPRAVVALVVGVHVGVVRHVAVFVEVWWRPGRASAADHAAVTARRLHAAGLVRVARDGGALAIDLEAKHCTAKLVLHIGYIDVRWARRCGSRRWSAWGRGRVMAGEMSRLLARLVVAIQTTDTAFRVLALVLIMPCVGMTL